MDKFMTDDEVQMMKSSRTEEQWNENCDAVKKAHGGYPADWYKKIVMSGVLRETASAFGSDGEIEIA